MGAVVEFYSVAVFILARLVHSVVFMEKLSTYVVRQLS